MNITGLLLAANVISPIDVPAFDNSAMDGYAFAGRSLESPTDTVNLNVKGTALAGRPHTEAPGNGECIRIMTGALMPPGCDTVVVPQELVTRNGDIICFPSRALRPGQNRRLSGEDLARGKPALRGRIVQASDLGLMASFGIADVAVIKRLKVVALFSAGDELRSVGETLTPSTLYDSNRYALYAMLKRLGVETIDHRARRPCIAGKSAASGDGSGGCCHLSSGDVSVGDADFTRELMNSVGDVAFWKIAMRPGRPLALGRLWSGPHASTGESALFSLACPAIRSRLWRRSISSSAKPCWPCRARNTRCPR